MRKEVKEIINKLEKKRIKQGVSYSLDREIVQSINKICEEKEILPSQLVNEILNNYLMEGA